MIGGELEGVAEEMGVLDCVNAVQACADSPAVKHSLPAGQAHATAGAGHSAAAPGQ